MILNNLLLLIFLAFSPVLADAGQSTHLEKAQAFSKAGDWEEAILHFQKALEENPKNALAQANLGVAYSRLEKHKEALLAYDKAMAMGYNDPYFRYFRGLSFAKLKLYDEAIKEIKDAIKKDRLLPGAHYDLGLIYIMQGDHEKALTIAKKMYTRNRTNSEKLFRKIPSTYKVASIDNGGTLTGQVRLTGQIPKPRAFHLIHSPNIEFCSRISDGHGHRILHDFVINKNGGLKDTVIAFQKISKGKPFPQKLQTFHIDRCRSSHYVIGVKNGEDLLIENTDPIRHEIATYQIYETKVKQTSNKPVNRKSSQMRSAFVKPGSEEFVMKCNLHPFLQTHGLFIDNPYYAISDEQGNFEINDIPPGTYRVIAWHPFITTLEKTITIKADEKTEINFAFRGENERRKLYQNDTKGYRFNTWFDSGEKFYGGNRVDDPVEILQEFDNSERYIEN